MDWNVEDLRVTGDRSVSVTFRDGLSGTVSFAPTFFRGVFSPLADPRIFRQARVEHGALVWPGNVDLAPDALYDSLAATEGELLLV